MKRVFDDRSPLLQITKIEVNEEDAVFHVSDPSAILSPTQWYFCLGPRVNLIRTARETKHAASYVTTWPRPTTERSPSRSLFIVCLCGPALQSIILTLPLVREDTELVITVHYALEDPDFGVHFVPSNTPFFPEVAAMRSTPYGTHSSATGPHVHVLLTRRGAAVDAVH